jgi:uncharacterized lipoprotein YajG
MGLKTMMNLMRALGVFLLLAANTAYADDNGNTVLLPSIDVKHENIGQGQTITLHVDDQRANKTLGFVLKDDGEEAIPSTQDITEIIYYQMIEALKAKGFAIDNGAGPNVPSLTIRINALKYTVKTNFLTKDLKITTNLKAIVANGGGTLSKGYELDKTRKDFVIGGKDREKKRMTETISVALSDLANDTQVLKALVSHGPAAPSNSPGAPYSRPSASGKIEAQPLGPN